MIAFGAQWGIHVGKRMNALGYTIEKAVEETKYC